MIVPTDFWKKNTSKMIEESYNYLVVDIEHLQYAKERDRFQYVIQIMDVCNTLRMANEMYEKLNVKQSFQFDILYDVAKAVISETPFSKDQLKEYYGLMQEIEKFAVAVQSLFRGTDSLMIDSEIEMLLIGFSFDKQKELDQLDKNGNIHDKFFTLRYEVLEGKKKVDCFVKDAINLLEEAIDESNKNLVT